MQLISINIGKEQTLVRPSKTEQTGIFKQPVSGLVKITQNGLPGDFIGDHKHHGGPDQALYIYTTDDYAWWEQELGMPLPPGTFGENLTIAGLESGPTQIGDILRLGEVVLQATAPRIPCGTLAGRMKIPTFAKQFRFAGRPGIYCRVLSDGFVQAGESVGLEKFTGPTLTLAQAMSDYYEPDLTEPGLRLYLNAPIAIRMRVDKEKQLQTLLDARA